MQVTTILHKFKNIKRTGDNWTVMCPAHDDKHNSLSVGEGNGGRILLYCHAGCTLEEICRAAGVELKDLMPNSHHNEVRPRVVQAYDYQDEQGVLLYQNVRYEPKEFRQRRPNGEGSFTWSLKGVRRVPYRLPELVRSSAETLFLAEGEKDADNLAAAGLLASSFKNWRPEFNEYIKRFASVVILCDHDRSGVKQAADAASIIGNSARELKVLDLYADEPLPEKGGKDVSDWLPSTGTVDGMLALAAAAPTWHEVRQPSGEGMLTMVRMADVIAEEVHWVWHPYIPLGKLTILEGDPGLGKSWITCALAAAITRGRGLPGTEPFEPANVLMLTAEDGLADTLRPRLDAAGADCTRVFALAEPVTFDTAGLLRLEATIDQHSPLLVIIDPLFAYTGGKVDIHRANECRAVTSRLAAIAERWGCSMTAVRHLGKSRGGGHALNAGIGSIDITAAARSVLLVGQDPDDPPKRALVQTKNNLAPYGEAIGYTLEGGRFYWTGASTLTAGRILSLPSNEEGRHAKAEAVEFLRSALSDGPRPAKEIKNEALQLGLTEQNLRTARAHLGVQVRKEGGHFGDKKKQRWVWILPAAEDVKNNGNQHLQVNGGNKNICDNGLAEDVTSPEIKHVQQLELHLQATDLPDDIAFWDDEIISEGGFVPWPPGWLSDLPDEWREHAAQLEEYGVLREEAACLARQAAKADNEECGHRGLGLEPDC
jgi:hypothetical protein